MAEEPHNDGDNPNYLDRWVEVPIPPHIWEAACQRWGAEALLQLTARTNWWVRKWLPKFFELFEFLRAQYGWESADLSGEQREQLTAEANELITTWNATCRNGAPEAKTKLQRLLAELRRLTNESMSSDDLSDDED
jgi:hypothetical protein